MPSLVTHFEPDVTVPVEIRDQRLALVARGLSSEPVEVPAGTYVVSARLPGGEQRSAVATVEESAQTVMFSLAASGREGRSPDPAVSHDVWLAPPEGRGVAPGLERLDTRALSRYEFPLSEGPEMVPLIAQGGERMEVFIARSEGIRSSYEIDPSAQPPVQLHNAEAQLLLEYLRDGAMHQSQALLESQSLSARKLLKSKLQDPVAAAAGAYALLRLGRLEDLFDWTENLRRWFVLTDGAIADAERLALLGNHDGALRALLELRSKDLPALTVGLSIACDRIRIYAGLYPDNTELGDLLDRYGDLAARAEWSQPLTTLHVE